MPLIGGMHYGSLELFTVGMNACLVTQSCLTLCDPMDCNVPSTSVPGTFRAKILEWVAIPFFRGTPQPRIEPGSPALQVDFSTC